MRRRSAPSGPSTGPRRRPSTSGPARGPSGSTSSCRRPSRPAAPCGSALTTATSGAIPRPGAAIGLHVGAQWVLAERLAGPAAVQAAIQRVEAERRAEDLLDSWWSAAPGSTWPARGSPRASRSAPGDEDSARPGLVLAGGLGQGRRHALDGRPGDRLSRARGRRRRGSLARLLGRAAARPRHRPRLGGAGRTGRSREPDRRGALRAVAGLVGRARGAVRGAGRARPRHGRDEPPRVPRALVPGSSDDRALGLAVKRIWLA